MPKNEERKVMEEVKEAIPQHETKSIPVELARGAVKEMRNTKTGQNLFTRDPEATKKAQELGPEWIVK